MSNPVAAFFIGRGMAGGEGVDRTAENSARTDARIAENNAAIAKNDAAQSQDTSLALAVALKKEREKTLQWGSYADRLNVNLAARKMSEATLLAELKKANISHPMATEEGFQALFEKMREEQYGILDQANESGELSPFEIKSNEEVGKERADVK